jgi:amino-acid N-acetyltransferase
MRPAPVVVLRPGTAADAPAIAALVRSHQDEGHLLPRRVDEIRRQASRFVVAEAGGVVCGCADLAPLSAAVAEVRSLVVSAAIRRSGVATRLIDELRRRARHAGFDTLCAFTHDPGFFVWLNFSVVPHQSVPEKIRKDCVSCPLFRRCGQHALVLQVQETTRHGANNAEDRRMAVA